MKQRKQYLVPTMVLHELQLDAVMILNPNSSEPQATISEEVDPEGYDPNESRGQKDFWDDL